MCIKDSSLLTTILFIISFLRLEFVHTLFSITNIHQGYDKISSLSHISECWNGNFTVEMIIANPWVKKLEL